MINFIKAGAWTKGARRARAEDSEGAGCDAARRRLLGLGAGGLAAIAAPGAAMAAFGVMPTDEVYDWREAMMLEQAETMNVSDARRAEHAMFHNPDPDDPPVDLSQEDSRLIPFMPGERHIVLDNKRGDVFGGVYFRDGHYVQGALQQISYLFRDHRSNQVHAIDPGLLDVLHAVRSMLDANDPVQVISGYRTRQSNAILAAHSSRVARNSLHISGKAADIRIPSRGAQAIRTAAVSMQTGGVGYYGGAGFVHLDTGEFRTW